MWGLLVVLVWCVGGGLHLSFSGWDAKASRSDKKDSNTYPRPSRNLLLRWIFLPAKSTSTGSSLLFLKDSPSIFVGEST